MSQVFAGARRAGGAAASKGNAVAAAVDRLFRTAAPDKVALKRELVAAAREVRDDIAGKASSATTIAKSGAKRRVRLYKARKSWNARVVLSTAPDANVIHAGRLKISTSRGRVRSIPGVDAQGAFLIGPKKFRGKERRVYRRVAGGSGGGTSALEPVQHPLRMAVFYKASVPLAERLVERRTRAQRARQAAALKAAGLKPYKMRARTRLR